MAAMAAGPCTGAPPLSARSPAARSAASAAARRSSVKAAGAGAAHAKYTALRRREIHVERVEVNIRGSFVTVHQVPYGGKESQVFLGCGLSPLGGRMGWRALRFHAIRLLALDRVSGKTPR